MALHLIKLSVGTENLADMAHWQKQRGELVHVTRQTPKRAEELLDGGSIYWVIKGFVLARQRLLELRPMTWDNVPHCGLVYAPELIRVVPRPTRAFQGWRYLQGKDAPKDLRQGESAGDETLLRELAELGLV